jgi:hypothetical protein
MDCPKLTDGQAVLPLFFYTPTDPLSIHYLASITSFTASRILSTHAPDICIVTLALLHELQYLVDENSRELSAARLHREKSEVASDPRISRLREGLAKKTDHGVGQEVLRGCQMRLNDCHINMLSLFDRITLGLPDWYDQRMY